MTEVFTHIGVELAASRVSLAQATHCATVASQLFNNLSEAQQGIIAKLVFAYRQTNNINHEWCEKVAVRLVD